MDKNTPKSYLGIVIILGAVWGLSEAALGFGLRKCASLISGSLMTGVALFFIAASWYVSRRIVGVVLLVMITCLFKMFDALLLSLPLKHGAVANPIFAFIMEGLAFLVIMAVAKEKLFSKRHGPFLAGGIAALIAVSLFPLVKFATGITACVLPGTRIPLSLYYAPIAVTLSLLTVPFGFWAGEKIRAVDAKLSTKWIRLIFSPATFLLCIGIITLIRLS